MMLKTCLAAALVCLTVAAPYISRQERRRRQTIFELEGQLCDPRGAVPAPYCENDITSDDSRLSPSFIYGLNVCAVNSPSEVANVEFRWRVVFATGSKGVSGQSLYCLGTCLNRRSQNVFSFPLTSRCCKGFAYQPAKTGCPIDLSKQATTQAPTTTQATTQAPTTTQATTQAPITTQATTQAPTTTQATTQAPTTQVPLPDVKSLMAECSFNDYFTGATGTIELKQEDATTGTVIFGNIFRLPGGRYFVFVHEGDDVDNYCDTLGALKNDRRPIARVSATSFGRALVRGTSELPVSYFVGNSLSILDRDRYLYACCAVQYAM